VLAVLPGSDLRVAELADVWAQVVLAQVPVSTRLRGYFRTGPLADVARYDTEHRTPLLESLRVYLESFGDMVGAAARLHVHPNTLRYRLRRIRELTGLDLEDPDARLAVALQLRLATVPTRVPPDDPDEE
jgi:sugar diacid utilization regulator